MIRLIRKSFSLFVGIVFGVALPVVLQQPRQQWTVLNKLIVLCGLGILLVAVYLIGRTILHYSEGKMDVPRTQVQDKALFQVTDADDQGVTGQMRVKDRDPVRDSLRLMLAFLSGVVGIATVFTGYMQVQGAARQNELLLAQNAMLDMQNQLVENGRRATVTTELTNILSDLEVQRLSAGSSPELDSAGQRPPFKPSVGVVGRIVALSRSFRPYRFLDVGDAGRASYWNADNAKPQLIQNPLSPERGHLLLTLLDSEIDITSFVDAGINFSYADLRGALLDSVQLRGSLSGIDLRRANLTIARLNGADLNRANLSRATLRDASLRVANLPHANLKGATLHGAILFRANLAGASLQDADLEEAWLIEANLDSTDLRGAQLPPAFFFQGARMHGTNLDGAMPPSPDWLQDLRAVRPQPVGIDWSIWINEARTDHNYIVRRSNAPPHL